ncbi:MAG TPA: hypothetical protein VFF23_12295 [Hanamia sp.]|nr:hypothetical protein [Hanamia sp.]
MESKISIMAFPQKQVGNSLFLNVLAIVRNYNPLTTDDLSTAWVDSKLRLQAMVIDSPDEYPRLNIAATPYDLPGVQMSAQAKNIFTFLKSRFKITKTANDASGRADKSKVNTLKKYLPLTYRQSFNFTSVRDKNSAVINDDYHCAIKGQKDPDPNFAATITDETSWGKVFAFVLRHKELAKKCGFIHENLEIKLPDDTFKNGGWLYIDIHPDCSYYADVQADKNYIKRYAARIPKLDFTKNRSLFASVEFPVLLNENAPAPDEPLQPSEAILDQMFIEAAMYSDGFCKIVHNFQPLSNSLIREEQDDESPVTNDIGIRLGWDDEQLAIWHSRQMNADPATGNRPDAPLCVFQYRVDARETADDPNTPNKWISLCKVKYDKDVFLNAEKIGNKDDSLEMGVEVYPSKPHPDTHFWLPAYFSQWIGNSLALQDEDAIAIYHKDQIDKNHLSPKNIYDPQDDLPFKAVKNDYYKAVGLENIALLYGHQYDFRVRMSDITGGGPSDEDEPEFDAPSPITTCLFKRHVIPQTFNFVTSLPQSDASFFEEKILSIKRPLLGYPSVLFTGAYPDAVNKLIADADAVIAGNLKRDVGLFDPDVNRVEITVEVKCLALDATIRKLHAKDNFALLYVTTRNFEAPFDSQLDLDLNFIDAPVLNFFAGQELPDMGLHPAGDTNIDKRADIVLPTARDIRISVRPLTATKPDYYGGTTTGDRNGPNRTELRGMSSSFMTRSAAKSEKDLVKPTGENMMIRAVYLQPEEPIKIVANLKKLLVENLSDTNQTPTIMDRLAAAVGTDSKGMSLTGRPGQRWQFGVSRFIRHTSSPDNTSITFATKNDLLNHWIVPVTLLIDRDWSWDGLQPVSFNIYRRKIFVRDAMEIMGATNKEDFLSDNDAETVFSNPSVKAAAKEELVGDIEFKQAINITALTGADRSQTFAAFIDAVEPKQNDEKKFPDELMLAYRITANFNQNKEDNSLPAKDGDVNLFLHLPVTTPPSQMPKIVSAGMAFSKYVRDENYANTENRKKYLWVEFAEPIKNPDDAYYARMLAYAPDVLLARWEPELLIAKKDPSLPLDPEFIRIISPASSDDKTGCYAMQEMIPASDSDVHFLLPLPPSIHAEALEMFGFFTYEFRVGHKLPWTTAQGRFGRALRHTGIQFPPPQLFCVPNRNEKYISVTAPYAQTVFDGRNITANPPRTQLWALLYAQVRMADDSDTRNVLIADRKLRLMPQKVSQGASPINTDATTQGITGWLNKEVEQLLNVYGLPLDSALSVLTVELMPGYDNFLVDQRKNQSLRSFSVSKVDSTSVININSSSVNQTNFKQYMRMANESMQQVKEQIDANLAKDVSTGNDEDVAMFGIYDDQGPRPLTSDLGNSRILRTSTLIAVPEVCCTV